MNQVINQIQNLPTDLIEDPESPMRSGMNDENLNALSASIKTIGVLEPIIVRRKGQGYEVIAGHRRLCATKMAGIVSIPAIVKDAGDVDVEIMKVHENLYREEVDAVDEAHFIKKSLSRLGASISEFARMISKSEQYVRGRLDILEWDGEIMAAVKSGELSISAARILEKITDLNIKREYAIYAKNNGATADVVRNWYESWRIGALPPQPTAEIIQEPETKTERTIWTVDCKLCRGKIPAPEARLFYAHEDCIKQIN